MVDITGLKFSELPEEFKDAVLSYSFNNVHYDDITEQEKHELFRRINNGKPLSTKEKNVAYCRDIVNVMDIGQHELLKDMLTEKRLEGKAQVSVVMKIWAMLNMDISEISFESKKFNEILQKTEITTEQRLEMLNTMNYAHDVFNLIKDKKVKNKVKKEIHMVSMIPVFGQAIDDGINVDEMVNFVEHFYGFVDDKVYNEACSNKTASNNSIEERNTVLFDEYALFFSE